MYVVIVITVSTGMSLLRLLCAGMLVSLRSVSVGSEGDGLCTSTLRELRILSQLRHTHIIRLLEIVRDRTSQDATYTSPSGTAVSLLEHCGEWFLLIFYRANLCWNGIYCHKSVWC